MQCTSVTDRQTDGKQVRSMCVAKKLGIIALLIMLLVHDCAIGHVIALLIMLMVHDNELHRSDAVIGP